MLNYKKHIALFYLIFFISIKFVGLHAFTHNDDKHHDDCNVCEFVIISNATPLLTSESVSFKHIILQNYNKQLFYEYSFQFIRKLIDTTLFCRPPPNI